VLKDKETHRRQERLRAQVLLWPGSVELTVVTLEVILTDPCVAAHMTRAVAALLAVLSRPDLVPSPTRRRAPGNVQRRGGSPTSTTTPGSAKEVRGLTSSPQELLGQPS
jgi:hypothetical protein